MDRDSSDTSLLVEWQRRGNTCGLRVNRNVVIELVSRIEFAARYAVEDPTRSSAWAER